MMMMTMNKKRLAVVTISTFILSFTLFPLNASGDEVVVECTPSRDNESGTNSTEGIVSDVTNKCGFSVTKTPEPNSSSPSPSEICMLITDWEDIPEKDRGTQTFHEYCDGFNVRCKLAVNASYEHDGKTKYCLKPTHLVCDQGQKRCVCSDNGIPVSSVRFQFGTYADTGVNFTDGRCLIRPTFDYIDGYDCSPGTKDITLHVDEKQDALHICGCENQAYADKLDTSDPYWWKWKCPDEVSGSSRMKSQPFLTTTIIITALCILFKI